MEWNMETFFEEFGAIEERLLQDGLPPNAHRTEWLTHLWHLYLRTEGSMNAARLEVKALQEAHDRENMQVQRKLDQVQVLVAKQHSFNVKYKEENQRLCDQLKQLKLEKEDQMMEVTELLEHGGLGDIVASSPSEQVAYLLAERTSLLERLQALEVEKCALATNPETAPVFKDGMDKLSFHKAVPSRGQSSWKKLLGLRKTAQSKQKLAVSSDEGPTEDSSAEQQRLERDLDEASCRLSMAHKEIRRLTDELESAHMTQKTHEAKLQELELLKQGLENMRRDDESELCMAKELNERLDKEIRILRDRVRSMDNEHVALLALVDKQMMAKSEDESSHQKSLQVEKVEIGIQADIADMENAHLRCLEDLKEKELELCKLQASMQQLQQELSEMQLQREQAQQLRGEQEQRHRATVEALKSELEFLGTVVKQAQAQQQEQESQKALIDDYKAQECLLQQKTEECAEMKEVLGHTTGLLHTAEAEVLSGKEKITELEKLIAELNHKNQQMNAEQQKALARMSELERNRESQSAELQKLVEKSKELQHHLDMEQNLQHQNNQLETKLKQAQAEEQEQHALTEDYKALAKDQECLLQQKTVECTEMKEVLGHTIGLLRTAEAEVLSGKEKITELEKLNAELDHKNQKDQECLLQQKAEECAEMKEVLGHTIGLLRTSEAEVLSGKERMIELEKINAELNQQDQECLLQQKTVECAEMKEVLGHTIGLLRTAEAEVLSGKEKITELEKLNAELNQQMVAEQLQHHLDKEQNLQRQNEQLETMLEQAQAQQQEQHTFTDDYKALAKDQECLLQQKAEECAEMKEVLGNTIGLLRTAEAEVLSGKEKITELEKLNAELNHKNQQLQESLDHLQETFQVEKPRRDVTASDICRLPGAMDWMQQRRQWLHIEGEFQQVMENLLKENSTLQLQAQQKNNAEVLELQEKVKTMTLELELVKAENAETHKAQEQEAEKQRISWLFKERELQREIQSLQDKQSSLTLSNQNYIDQVVELHAKLGNRVELEKHRELRDQLNASQTKLQKFAEEMESILNAKDKELRRCHGKINQLKGKLSRAEIIHIKEKEWRDNKIEDHKKKCDLLTEKVDKMTETAKKMDEANTNLLKENRALQGELLQEKEAKSEHLRIIRRYKIRIEYFEKLLKKMENYIQDQLWNSGQRTRPYSHDLPGAFQSSTDESTFPRGDTMRDLLDIIRNPPTEDMSPAQSSTHTQTSENGYLNLTPPFSPPSRPSQSESGGVVSEEAL